MRSSSSDSDSDPEGAELPISLDQRERKVPKKKMRKRHNESGACRTRTEEQGETTGNDRAKPEGRFSDHFDAFYSGRQTESESIGAECVVHQ